MSRPSFGSTAINAPPQKNNVTRVRNLLVFVQWSVACVYLGPMATAAVQSRQQNQRLMPGLWHLDSNKHLQLRAR